MSVWQICLIAGLGFLILEMFAPLTFFLSLSIGAFASAIVAVWFTQWSVLIPVFAVFSITALLVFRPFLAKSRNGEKTSFDDKYIGKTVKVIENINKFNGAITIYDERWEARSISEDEFFVDSEVKIVKNESLIMYVEKL